MGSCQSPLGTRAAIFDLDGTLVDTEPRNQVSWQRLFDQYGAPYDEDVMASFVGRRGPEVLADMLHLFPGRSAEDLSREAVGLAEREELPPVQEVPGAVALLRELYGSGVPLGIVTSGGRRYAEGMLDALGVRALPDVVITADDVTIGKPDPEGFLAACRVLETEPARAIAFEDSLAGLAAARAAGMGLVVGVATTLPADRLTAADLVVRDLTEVKWPPRRP